MFAVLLATFIGKPVFADKQFVIAGGFEFGYNIGAGINYYEPTDEKVPVSNARHASFAWNLHIDKYFTQHIGVEVGYTNYGLYENQGQGFANCDQHGNCDYPAPRILPLPVVFHSYLNVNNRILVKAAYLTLLLREPLSTDYALYTKLGAAYTWANIDSDVVVDPQVGQIGPTFDQYDPVGSETHIEPFAAIGLANHISKDVILTTEFDWNGIIKMSDYRGLNGRLMPMAVMVGMNYAID